MPNPKEVFENPEQFLTFLQSQKLEGQLFERKEMKDNSTRHKKDITKKMIQTISGFANSNRDGGLLVLGIDDNGTITGLNHIEEATLNGILQTKEQNLKGHSTQGREVHCQDAQRVDNKIYLLFTPWTPDAICETTHSFPEAWKREGAQCLPLTDLDREQLRQDKGIIDFESRIITPYDPDELDQGLTEVFSNIT